MSLPSSTVSDWLRGKSVPSDRRAFLFLVGYLERKAARIGGSHAFLTRADWELLLEQAQGHRRSNQGGRPACKDPGAAKVRPPPGRTTTRLAYLEQVRRIAPPDLAGRNEELAELARFCLEPGRGPYTWWQAGPWAGKSALLSTFVLRPPPQVQERVTLVSFFITARLAAQDTREAFTEVLLGQLALLTGQAPPATLSEATREAYLLHLMAQAAETCQEAGGRLVLVVDGLDEDRSVTTGPHAHSIAGLLPGDLPAGMRVIVAGRPNPPIPDDVPDWHPLRDPAAIQLLADSAYAHDARRLGRQELQRLLRGSATDQDVLGLLVKARGGLSGPDLAELTGAPLWEVEKSLHSVAGRTFTRRPSRSASVAGSDVYLLGHEELQTAATYYLADRLPDYEERLHDWADTYRGRGWPAETPEYLLVGYFALLSELGELPRIVSFGLNRLRHDRMLSVTGGDAAALAEVRTALNFAAAEDSPDMATALALACRRDQLTDRNTNIPASLPAVWAIVGHTVRAQALASSLSDPVQQASAHEEIAEALAQAGHYQQAEILARSITNLGWRERALADIAQALAQAGHHQQAETLARSITDPGRRGQALAPIAEALAQAGHHQQAETLARSITNPGRRERALADIAQALAQAGHHQQAETLARSITGLGRRGQALAPIAEALAQAGHHQQAETLARSITSQGWQAQALAGVWTTPGILEAVKPGRMQGHGGTAEVSGGAA